MVGQMRVRMMGKRGGGISYLCRQIKNTYIIFINPLYFSEYFKQYTKPLLSLKNLYTQIWNLTTPLPSILSLLPHHSESFGPLGIITLESQWRENLRWIEYNSECRPFLVADWAMFSAVRGYQDIAQVAPSVLDHVTVLLPQNVIAKK